MGKGGWRSGAGRPARHLKTGRHRYVDIRRLARESLLQNHSSYLWSWKDESGQVQASVKLVVAYGGVHFSYLIDGHKNVAQHVEIVGSACNYGGERVWFSCPCCRRRCALMYISDSVACRRCLSLRYNSQSEDAMDRLRRKQSKLEDKLGGTPVIFKPKGMHQKTFDRIRQQVAVIERRRTEFMVRKAAAEFPGVFDDMLKMLDD